MIRLYEYLKEELHVGDIGLLNKWGVTLDQRDGLNFRVREEFKVGIKCYIKSLQRWGWSGTDVGKYCIIDCFLSQLTGKATSRAMLAIESLR